MEQATEKPGTAVMRVRVPRAARFLPESTFSADSLRRAYHPHVQSHASTSVRTLKKIPNAASRIYRFGHTEILHTLIETGSAALEASVLYPGKATRISRKRTKKYQKYIIKIIKIQ